MFKKIALALFGVMIAFLAGEIAVRILPKRQGRDPIAERPHFFYLPARATSPHGNLPLAQGDVFRVAVVGDSFTFAPKMQFDDSFSARLQRMLNLNDPAVPVEVLNYGFSGFSTFHEIKEVRKAIGQGADLVILEVTLNDPQRAALVKTPADFALADLGKSYGFLGSVLARCSLCNLVRERIHNARSVQRYIDYHEDLFDNPETWVLFRDSVKKIQVSAQNAHVRLGVVLFPLLDFPLDGSYPFKRLHKKVEDLCRDLGIPFLDLFHAFHGLDPKRLQLLPGRDSHPNEIGHRIAAEAIYRWLEHEMLIPEETRISYRCKFREGMKAKRSAWGCKREGRRPRAKKSSSELQEIGSIP